MCQRNPVSFMITIKSLTDNLSLYLAFCFSNPKTRRKLILEPDVRAFGQEKFKSAFWITSSILISGSWDLHLNLIFWWMGEKMSLCWKFQEAVESDGAEEWSSPSSPMLTEIEIKYVLPSYHVPDYAKKLHTHWSFSSE